MVVQGTGQGVDVLLRVLAVRGQRRVAVEDPSLSMQRGRIEALGLQVIGCNVDENGIVVEDLDADAAIVTPAHQFPTGVVLSGERRRALLAWAVERAGLVIEDDYEAEFRYDREPVRALQGLDPERVAYLGTASKSLAPALRLGWLVVPRDLADDAAGMKLLVDHGSPVLDQLALKRLIEAGDYDRHVRRVRAIYQARRDRLSAALADQLPELEVKGVAAGLHVLLELPPDLDDELIAREAARDGVCVEPLSRSALARRDSSGLVIGYGRLHETALEPAVAALASAIERVRRAETERQSAGAASRTPASQRRPRDGSARRLIEQG